MRLPIFSGLALIAGVGLCACTENTTSTTTAPAAAAIAPTAAPSEAAVAEAQPAEDQAASELKEHHRHHHLGGVTQFVAMSLDTLGTDEAKRPQIEKLQSDLHICMAPVAKIEHELLLTYADGVAAGKIDAAKVDASLALLSTTAAAVHGCSVATLNKLHAILSPTERQALVDKTQAHWEVWRNVNHEAEVGGKENGGRLAELIKELSLTPDQVEKISATLHTGATSGPAKFDPAKGEAHMQAFAKAFAGEKFDAKSVTADANSHLVTHGSRRAAHFYETVTPLLTPEQQKTLAEHLREHAAHQPQANQAK